MLVSRYLSFARQVQFWAFKRKRDGSEKGYYFHELFIKDKPEFLRFIVRPKRSTVNAKANSLNLPTTARSSPIANSDIHMKDGVSTIIVGRSLQPFQEARVVKYVLNPVLANHILNPTHQNGNIECARSPVIHVHHGLNNSQTRQTLLNRTNCYCIEAFPNCHPPINLPLNVGIINKRMRNQSFSLFQSQQTTGAVDVVLRGPHA